MTRRRKTRRRVENRIVDVEGGLPGHRHITPRRDVMNTRNIHLVSQEEIPIGHSTQPIQVTDTVTLERDFDIDDNSNYVIIYQPKLREIFLDHGIIGESVGYGARKSDRRFERSKSAFTLSPYDIFYAYDEIKIIKPPKTRGRLPQREALIKWGRRHDPDFLEKYSIYRALKSRGLILLDGHQYGSDFTIYQDTPEEFRSKGEKAHSIMIVNVENKAEDLSTKKMIKYVRFSNVIQKDFVIMKARGDRDEKGILLKESKDVVMFIPDVESMGVDTSDEINSQIMRKIINSRSYNAIPIEIIERRG